MAWIHIKKAPLYKSERKDPPEGFWVKCPSCGEILYKKDYVAALFVCPKCQNHSPISARTRVQLFCDRTSFEEADQDLRSYDALGFEDRKPYKKRLEELYNHSKWDDALLCGRALLKGRPIQMAVFDFEFMGGSMGSVVGEKIARTFLRGADRKEPVIIFSTSGGARMQEGILSLMQMAKTCTALAILREAQVPLISIMTHPTTGGVAASYAMLGDINIGEPGALIGFAGPRVIAQTIRQSLPEGFQTSEYLLQHGMLDLICHRKDLRDTVSSLLGMLFPMPSFNERIAP